MQNDLFLELSLIIGIGAVVSLVMKLLKQPLIIGYILTGLLVGPTVLNLATNNETLEIFSDIGIALLLFLVGLGLNPKIIKEVGKVAVFTGVGQVLFTTAIGFFLVKGLLGTDTTGSLYVSIALAFSSTIIILKLLSDKKEQTRLHGKIATGFLLVQDILATFALLFVSANGNGGLNTEDLIELGVSAVMLASGLYIIVRYMLPILNKTIASSQELLFLFSIAWGLGIGAVFSALGFSLEVGALAAGVSLAQFSYAQEIAARLKPLRDFFIVLFFVVLGSQLDLDQVASAFPQAIVLSLFVLIGNPIIVMIIMGILGYTKKISFKTSLAVAQISEFSLVLLLLAHEHGQIDKHVLSVATLVGLITIGVSSYIILYDEKLYPIFEKHLRLFERKKTKSEKSQEHTPESLIIGYTKGGTEFVKVFKAMKKRFAVVDYNPEIIDVLAERSINHLYGDVTDLEFLEEVNIHDAKMIVSVLTNFETNSFLLRALESKRSNSMFICHANSRTEAAHLYELGAEYVMLPHYIGSEKIGAFIRKNGINRSAFEKFRRTHIDELYYYFDHHNHQKD